MRNKYEEAFARIDSTTSIGLKGTITTEFGTVSINKQAFREDMTVIQGLVKRATPMKPLFAWDYKCPNCNKFITNGSKWQCEKYCDNCGQAIDWKAANEERETERLIAQGRTDAL